MAVNGHVPAELSLKLLNELHDRHALCRSAGVLGSLFTVVGNTPDIGDTNGVGVLPLGMGADAFNGSSLVNRAVAVDYKVVSDVGPAVTLYMPLADLRYRKVLPFGSGGAMQDDFRDFSLDNERLVIVCREPFQPALSCRRICICTLCRILHRQTSGSRRMR